MNNSKIVTFSPEARRLLFAGASRLADAVKVTLGPKGRNVIIQAPYGTPLITKDGVTVAREINLEDPIENLGAAIIKQAASATARQAGDGTTTATVLAQSLLSSALTLIDEGYSPIEIKRGYDKLLEKVLHDLRYSYSSPVTDDDIKAIATISSNNDSSIGSLIAEGFKFVGRDGLIMVDDSKTADTYVDTVNGSQIKSPILSPYFVTDPVSMTATYEDALVLVTDKKLRSAQELIPLLNEVAKSGKPLLIIADEVEGQALNLLVLNRMKAQLPIIAIKAPAYADRRAEILKDIAILTGAELVSDAKSMRLEDVKLSSLGKVSKVIADRENTLLIDPQGRPSDIQTRLENLQIEFISSDHEWGQQKIAERMAALQGKVAVLYVGAPTEAELKEKKDRIDDALRATKSSVQGGYTAGGGLTLYKLSSSLDSLDVDQKIKNAYITALKTPLITILSNAGEDVSDITSKIDASTSKTYGFNSATSTFVDLVKDGVIDPTLVVESALTFATSAAGMIALSEVTIHNSSQNFYSPGSLSDFQ